MSLEQNKDLVRRYVNAVLINQDFSNFDEFAAPGFHIDRSAIPYMIEGAEGLGAQMDMLYKAFPDLKIRIADMVAEGNKVVVRFEAPGTHTGDFMGIPPSNAKVVWKGLVMYEVIDGKITQAWANWDDFGLIEQVKAAVAA